MTTINAIDDANTFKVNVQKSKTPMKPRLTMYAKGEEMSLMKDLSMIDKFNLHFATTDKRKIGDDNDSQGFEKLH